MPFNHLAISRMENNIIISTRTILILLTTVLVLWLMVQISNILLAIFVSLILTLGLNPLVDWLTQQKLSRTIAVTLTYIFFLGLVVGLFALALPPMASQVQNLVQRLPLYVASISVPGLEAFSEQFLQTLVSEVSKGTGDVLKVTLNFFSNAFSVVTVLVLTFYFLLDYPNIKKMFLGLYNKGSEKRVAALIGEIEEKIGGWLRGQVFLMFIVGLASFVGLTLLQIDYALSLAVIAGFLEIVPLIGPIVSFIPAAIVASAKSPLAVLLVAVLYILIQQLESNLVIPKVMQKVVGFAPIVTLIAIMIGGKLFGVLGALLSLPTTLMGYLVIRSLLEVE
jgi:predicted PurR-regulated permease PerM